jgi:hypothetical protein
MLNGFLLSVSFAVEEFEAVNVMVPPWTPSRDAKAAKMLVCTGHL